MNERDYAANFFGALAPGIRVGRARAAAGQWFMSR